MSYLTDNLGNGRHTFSPLRLPPPRLPRWFAAASSPFQARLIPDLRSASQHNSCSQFNNASDKLIIAPMCRQLVYCVNHDQSLSIHCPVRHYIQYLQVVTHPTIPRSTRSRGMLLCYILPFCIQSPFRTNCVNRIQSE